MTKPLVAAAAASTEKKQIKLEAPRGDTELITRLTRARLNKQLPGSVNTKRATQTKFEQNLVALKVVAPAAAADSTGKIKQLPDPKSRPKTDAGCRLKTQVMFESDTDSSMVLDQQQRAAPGNQQQRANKELHSETKFSSASGRRTHSPLTELDEPEKDLSPRSSVRRAEKKFLAPNCMDYSLRVHRMRGNQIDSKVR